MADDPKLNIIDYAASNSGKLEFKSETSEEKASRLRREEADATFKRWREVSQHIITQVGVVVIVGFCLFFLADKNADAEAKKWASTTLTAVATGVIGYLYGKSSAKE